MSAAHADPAPAPDARVAGLRERAEQLLGVANTVTGEATDLAHVLEELRIHQAELEAQNEELRCAQQEAELARSRYQILFGQMPLPALVLNAQGHVQHSNERADALLGPRRSVLAIDNRLLDATVAGDRARLSSGLREMAHNHDERMERVGLCTQGQADAPFDVYLIRLSDRFHVDPTLLAIMVDRSADAAHEREQNFFSQFLNSTQDFVYAADKDGRLVIANQALLGFLDRPPEQVLGQPRESYLPLRDVIAHREADRRVMQDEQPITLEEQVYFPDTGGTREFLTRKFPLRDLQGNIHGIGGISTEITEANEQKRQAALSESVFLAAAEAILITDASTRIVRVNPAFTRLTGFSEESILGRKLSVLSSGRHGSEFYAQMWEQLQIHGHWAGEMTDRSADGRVYTVWNSSNAICNADGTVTNYVAVQTDLTQLREAQSQVQLLASYDSLTGLPNRSLFSDRIKQLLAYSLRHHKSFALMFLDLDHFKEVNDTLGHAVGDDLLRAIADRLGHAVRAEDTVARMGGDEFVILMPSIDRSTAQATAEKVLATVNQPLALGAQGHYQPMVTVGIALFPEDGESVDLLLRNADTAMYEAKTAGRNRCAMYAPHMSEKSERLFTLQNALKHGIANNELRLYFQPKVDLKTGAMVGAEALVRWERPGHGLVPPLEFIGVAERSGLILEVDAWVMRTAVEHIARWHAQGLWPLDWRLAVNQCAADLRRPSLVGEITSLLQQHALPAQVLEVEITESALLDHTVEIIGRMQELQALGIALAIDDFGTGFSSLAYLRDLPISVIKIDRSFVRDMLTKSSDSVLVQTIVAMAHNLGHQLVAEGIELPEQRVQLLQLGCESGQGYLIAQPLNEEALQRAFLLRAAQDPNTNFFDLS